MTKFFAKNFLWVFLTASLLIVIAVPTISFAHEVYVLPAGEVDHAMNEPSFSLWHEALENIGEVSFWAFIGVLAVVSVFLISTMRFLERALDPVLSYMRRYATVIARVTIGLAFLAGAYYQALYGPELPLPDHAGPYAGIVTTMLVAMGLMIIIGWYARVAAFLGVIVYSFMVALHGSYMLTYINYLGEIIVLLILGAHRYSLDGYLEKRRGNKHWSTRIPFISKIGSSITTYLTPHSFAILRVLFGVALIYASVYAKILHNNLALLTVEQYHLDKILGFEPHFLVLGAAIVEIMIGVFFILGIEIRFTALFMLFWLTLSLIYFGEVVWPHLILIGIPIAYIFYGYDKYSVEGWFFRKKKYGPVL